MSDYSIRISNHDVHVHRKWSQMVESESKLLWLIYQRSDRKPARAALRTRLEMVGGLDDRLEPAEYSHHAIRCLSPST